MKPEPILRTKPIQFLDLPQAGTDSTHNVQLLKSGTFFHPEYGEINITSTYLEKMVNNFQEKVRGVDLAIDYAHNSESIAAGWIENLFLEEDALWAKVRWTKNGQQIVTDKEFRYLSADFTDNYIDNESQKEFGPTLFGAGLTNRPFVKGMRPVLELSDVPHSPPTPPQKGISMDEKDKKIQELEAKIAELTAQLEATKKASESDAAAKTIAELQAKLTDMEKAKALADKNTSFDKLLTEGKVCEAQRPHFISGDTVKFAETYVAPHMKRDAQGSSNEPPETEVKDKAEATAKVIEIAKSLLAEKKVRSIGEGQAKALADNPDLVKKIYG